MKENDIIIDDANKMNKIQLSEVNHGFCYIANENDDLKDNQKKKCSIL